MTRMNPAAEAAREQARRANGEFGTQQHSAPEGDFLNQWRAQSRRDKLHEIHRAQAALDAMEMRASWPVFAEDVRSIYPEAHTVTLDYDDEDSTQFVVRDVMAADGTVLTDTCDERSDMLFDMRAELYFPTSWGQHMAERPVAGQTQIPLDGSAYPDDADLTPEDLDFESERLWIANQQIRERAAEIDFARARPEVRDEFSSIAKRDLTGATATFSIVPDSEDGDVNLWTSVQSVTLADGSALDDETVSDLRDFAEYHALQEYAVNRWESGERGSFEMTL